MNSQPADNRLGSWPARCARMEREAIALTEGSRQMTYRQLRDRSASLASALAAGGRETVFLTFPRHEE